MGLSGAFRAADHPSVPRRSPGRHFYHSSLRAPCAALRGCCRSGYSSGNGTVVVVVVESSSSSGAVSHERVARLLSENLDYIVDHFCEDLRSHTSTTTTTTTTMAAALERRFEQSSGDGEEESAGSVSYAPAVLEALLVHSGAAASTPLLRDVLVAVLGEIDRQIETGTTPSNALMLLSTARALVTTVKDGREEEEGGVGKEEEQQGGAVAEGKGVRALAVANQVVRVAKPTVDTYQEWTHQRSSWRCRQTLLPLRPSALDALILELGEDLDPPGTSGCLQQEQRPRQRQRRRRRRRVIERDRRRAEERARDMRPP